jgi:hypothetical protein
LKVLEVSFLYGRVITICGIKRNNGGKLVKGEGRARGKE